MCIRDSDCFERSDDDGDEKETVDAGIEMGMRVLSAFLFGFSLLEIVIDKYRR